MLSLSLLYTTPPPTSPNITELEAACNVPVISLPSVWRKNVIVIVYQGRLCSVDVKVQFNEQI
jgi:hypothetical protein